MSMFCFQCQEAAHGVGCDIRGVCGKEPETAQLQDLLLHVARGLSVFARVLPEVPVGTGRWLLDALFTTITNANFDDAAIEGKIRKGLALRGELRDRCARAGVTPVGQEDHAATFEAADRKALLAAASAHGVRRTENEDVRSLRELLTYGLKGLAAYAMHAQEAGKEDPSLISHLYSALALSLLETDAQVLTQAVLATGAKGVKAMALLDAANTSRYGHPEITQVRLGVGTRPGILVSGHDLVDLEQLLEQTQRHRASTSTPTARCCPRTPTPAFKKYPNFCRQLRQRLVEADRGVRAVPRADPLHHQLHRAAAAEGHYRDRIFTTGAAGYPGCSHIETGRRRKEGLLRLSSRWPRSASRPIEIEHGEIVGGFAHDQVLALADKVVDAVKSGAIKKFFVMAGCDGRMKSREYYTDFAEDLPEDTVILTAGCAKYRYNKLDLGDIGGIPRVLDAGQCNDSYSLAVIALKLRTPSASTTSTSCRSRYNIAWYEQKAVIVLLALLHLGVKNIHLGPTLPAFLSPNVAKVLVDTFGIAGIGTAEEDLRRVTG